jgi:hypothetical protein
VAGGISIPLETRKKGESVMRNVVGSLQEFRELADGEELVWADGGTSYKGRFSLMPKVVADLVVIGLRGTNQFSGLKIESREVSAAGWIGLEELAEDPKLRGGVGSWIDMAIAGNWVGELIEGVKGRRKLRVLKNGDPLCDYITGRDSIKDWEGK